MDNFLADLYGTNEPTEESFEKVAHLDFLEKVAEEEGIDLDDLSDEDLEDLAEIAAEALDEEEGEYYEDDLEKEAEAKVEEADFLGRVMAHSFNQEMDSIEKQAGAREAARKAGSWLTAPARAVGRGVGSAWRGAIEGAGKAEKAIGRGAARGGSAISRSSKNIGGRAVRGARAFAAPTTTKGKIDAAARRLGKRLGAKSSAAGASRGASKGYAEGFTRDRPSGAFRKALDMATGGRRRRALVAAARSGKSGRAAVIRSQRRRGYGALGAGAAGLGAAGAGAAYAAGREKKSADEQWEDAVQARAWEHLMAAGLADDYGNYVAADDLFDKTASDEEVEYQLDADALELLESEGYPVEWY